MNVIPWTEKYRPETSRQVCGNVLEFEQVLKYGSESKNLLLHGPSGTGKSTFLNIISGLFIPNYGAVNICGKRLDRMRTSKRDQFRAKNIGYVFQQFNLVPFLNAIENVRLAMHFQPSKKMWGSDLDDIKN